MKDDAGVNLAEAGGGWDSPLWLLCIQLAVLSLTALGGGLAMLMPELQRIVVLQHAWMNDADFITAFTLAQTSPGPNFLYVTLVGFHMAGFAGAVAATLAVLVPSCLLCYALLRFGEGQVNPRLQRAMRDGLAPVSAGLMMSFGWVLCSYVDTNWRATLVTAVTVAILLRTKINPVWLVLAGALLGMAGLVA